MLGVPSREIIFDLAGGPPEGRSVKAWFPGGSSAPVLTGSDEHLDLPYDFDTLAKAGSMLGSGAIIVIDDSISIVDVALKTAKFYRHESCGKCTPCREGTNWTVKMLERIQSGEATPMDLDIMASVQEQIIGNCLCVLGDAMAMPIGSMIAALPRGVRGAHRGRARAQRARRRDPAGQPLRAGRRLPDGDGGLATMPRPEPHWITFSIDGREVRAPEGAMLVDAAKYGDVEIPVFCYEPKLGQPVGACRMCLVEIEGIPKLQTGCSTGGAGTAWSSTRRPTACTRRSARWSSSCSSTTRSTARSATRAASARCRTSPTAGARARRASSSPSGTSRSRSSCRR